VISDDYSNDKADRLLSGAPLQGDRSSWRDSKSSNFSYRCPGKRETFQVTIIMAAPEWRFYEAEFVKNLLALSTSAVRNASDVFGARFKLLSAGAGSKHGDLCNEQIRDSNERSNLSCGLFAQAPLKTRDVAAKKFICWTSESKFQWAPLLLLSSERWSSLFIWRSA
jgi:hypothetical protein